MNILQKSKQIMVCGIGLICLWSSVFAVSNRDLLKTVTDDTRTYETTLDKEANDVFDDSIGINLDLDPNTPIAERKDSLIVKVTRFMLKIAVLLAVPMIIYSGIKIVLSLGDEGAMKKTLIEIVHVVA